VLQGPDKGRTYHTRDEPTLIGRSSDQVQLTDDSASRRHAELRPVNGAWVLSDLKSSNATYVNGQRIVSQIKLKHGDQIRIGSTLMVFSGDESVASFSGPDAVRDLVDLDYGGSGGSSILSSIDASEESVILQPPETADAVAAWNALYKIAELIGPIESVDDFLERVVDIVFDHLIVDRLVLLMRYEGDEEMTPRLVRYRTRKKGPPPKITTSQTIINHVVRAKEGLLCANAMTDERFSAESSQDSIHRLGLRSVICVPIMMREEVQGIIHMDCSMSQHTYTQEQLRLAVAIGRMTGMAIENARLIDSRVKHERLAATGETVAYLSHHIRNMVQGLQGGGSLVDLGLRRNRIETVADGWKMLSRNLDRIFDLTMNMLTFSQDRKPKIEIAQLNHTIAEVIELSQNRADEKSVMILSELEDMPPVPIDLAGIHQVAHNIILNAIDACRPKTGRVNVFTRYDADAGIAVLSIADNGPGVAPEDRDKIFEAFHSSKGQGGTGLGLAAAKKIVDELGGAVEVETTLGEGTTFHVKLPTRAARTDSEKTHGAA
jgi:signal transduction histidine kinase